LHGKHAKIILFLLVIPAVSVMLYYLARFEPSKTEKNCFQRRSLSEQRMQVKRLRFSDHVLGKKTLDIRADEFTVEKMKMGHFRFSLFNVARLKNMKIDLFGQPTIVAGNPDVLDPREVTFKGILGKASLSPLGIKRISSMKAEPVRVRLYNQERLITSISASSAQFNLDTGQITFRGNVHGISGHREIQSAFLVFIPGKKSLEIGGSYRLKDDAGSTRIGKGFSCDLFLKARGPFAGQPWDSHEENNGKETRLCQNTAQRHANRLPPGF
jgi:hypothetical protein